MNHELICTWLGLEPGEWPPNHYRLLGLKPGESDSALIEQHVHQRLAAVRCYQVRHPDQATEAMNRLAQAFVCLTEPIAKQRYDAELFGPTFTPVRQSTKPQTMQGMPAFVPELLPPPANDGRATLPAAEAKRDDPPPNKVALPRPVPVPPRPPAEKVDPIREAARSPLARAGLGTRRALYRRIRHTRELFETWLQGGKFLDTVKRRTILKRPDREELADLFANIAHLCSDFPRILGEAGQPGYLVLFLARNDAVPEFRDLEPSQRDSLRRDWQAGRDLLLAHRDFLREQATELRLMTRRQRLGRALRSLLIDRPMLLFLLLGLAGAVALLGWMWVRRARG